LPQRLHRAPERFPAEIKTTANDSWAMDLEY